MARNSSFRPERNSSFRPQSEWNVEAKKSEKKSEWDDKPAKKSEWDAPPDGGGGKSSAAAANSKIEPALRATADKLKAKLQAIANQKAKGGEPDWKAVFRIFDTEGSGSISRLEFKRGMEKIGFDLPRDQMQGLQKMYFNGDGDNNIPFKEFVAFAKADDSAGRRKQWEDEEGWGLFDYVTLGFFAPPARSYSEYY